MAQENEWQKKQDCIGLNGIMRGAEEPQRSEEQFEIALSHAHASRLTRIVILALPGPWLDEVPLISLDQRPGCVAVDG